MNKLAIFEGIAVLRENVEGAASQRFAAIGHHRILPIGLQFLLYLVASLCARRVMKLKSLFTAYKGSCRDTGQNDT